MLKRLRLHNFQSHGDTLINLAPTVTAIVGLNNHGKSAIFRAIKKIVRNDPEGTTFIRDGERICEIEVETNRGTILRRIRSDNAADANLYKVDDVEYAKFGKTGIPDEVKEAMDVSDPQEFGDIVYDLNFQDQLDLLFLMQGTGLASLRGKVLGKITGVDTVQRAIQFGAGEERRLRREVEAAAKELEGTEAERKLYENVPELQVAVRRGEEQAHALTILQDTYAALQRLQEDLIGVIERAQRAVDLVGYLKIDMFDADLARIDLLQRRLGALHELNVFQLELQKFEAIAAVSVDVPVVALEERIGRLTQLEVLEKEFSRTRDRLVQVGQVCTLTVPELGDLETRLQNLAAQTALLSDLEDVVEGGGEAERKARLYKMELDLALEEQFQLEQELKVCPTCERPFA